MEPQRTDSWFYLLELVILNFTTMFTLMALFLFVLCGHLFVIFHKKTVEELKLLLNSKWVNYRSSDELIWSLLSHFRILCEAKRQLFYDFRPMLMMNCCLSVINILTCAYYSIYCPFFYIQLLGAIVVWDICDTLEFIFRLWLICHTVDQIRASVCDSIHLFSYNFINTYCIN